jgi:CRP-like cAMP-binding protein
MYLAEAKAQAIGRLAAGDPVSAIRLFDAALIAAPLDFECRMGVADGLVALGYPREAAVILRAAGVYALRSGHPLAAVVCARVLENLGDAPDDLLATLVAYYGCESELVDRPDAREAGRRAGRVSLPAGDTPIRPPELAKPPDPHLLAHAAGRAAHCTTDFEGFPETLHPIPLLSELSEAAFRRVLSTLVVHRLPSGALAIREGEVGTSFFFVATGAVRVVAGQRELASLHEGAIFGEMALLAAQPRSASVQVVGSADLLEITKDSIAALAGELDQVARALSVFTRDRLLGNLLATSPLFKPFSEGEKRELLRRFTSHDVGAGGDVIREGEPGQGLFVVLSGGCDVIVGQGEEAQHLSSLVPGDVFGEMALLRGGGATATVRANQPCTLLFLARSYVERIVAGVPEVRAYLEALAEDRALDTRLATATSGLDGDSSVLV